MRPSLQHRRALPGALSLVAVGAVVSLAAASHAGAPAAASHATPARSGAATNSHAAAPAASLRQSSPTGVGTIAVPAGFPSARTTGVPVGTALHVIDGNMTIKRDGTVIDGAVINGCVLVSANHVTIRNSKINCSGRKPALYLPGSYKGTLVSHVEVDGEGIATVGIEIKNATVDNVNVHGSGDGIHLGQNATLSNSYVHDLAVQSNLHHDCLQTLHGSTANDIRVLHNTLIAYTPTKADNTAYHMGSGSISNILVASNFMDGGHYTIQVDNGATQRNIVFRGNTFGRHYHWSIAYLGHRTGTAVSFVNNVWYGTGQSATPANSKGYGLAR